MEKSNSFVMYRDWIDGISALPKDQRLECYEALFMQGLGDEVPDDISAIAKTILMFTKTQMEIAKQRYEKVVETNKKRGAPVGNRNAKRSLDEQDFCEENNSEQNETNQNNSEQFETNQNNSGQIENKSKQFETNQNNSKQIKTIPPLNDNDNVNDNINYNYNASVNENEINSAPAREDTGDKPATRTPKNKKSEKSEKKKYGKYQNVLLTDEEYNSIMQREDGSEALEYYSQYREMKGYACKNDAIAIDKWAFDAVKERKQGKKRWDNDEGSHRTKANFTERNYSKEELNSLFIDMETLEALDFGDTHEINALSKIAPLPY